MGFLEAFISPDHLLEAAQKIISRELTKVMNNIAGERDLGAMFRQLAWGLYTIGDMLAGIASTAEHVAEMFDGVTANAKIERAAQPPPRQVATAAEATLANPTGSENSDVTSSAAA